MFQPSWTRQGLVAVAGLFAAGAIPAFLLYSRLLHWLLVELPRRDQRLIVLSPADELTARLRLSICCGIVVALPVLIWQAWWRLTPAVGRADADMRKRLVLLAWVLAVGGVTFGYYVVLPPLERSWLVPTGQLDYVPQLMPFVTTGAVVLLVTVIAFEAPLFIFGLGRRGSGSTSG